MNDEELRNSRFPKKMLILTFLVVTLVVVLHRQTFYLNETFNVDPGTISVATVVSAQLLILTWSIWAFFFAKLRLLGLAIFLAPFGFFTIFSPNFTGDIAFKGFKFRYWAPPSLYVELDGSAVKDVDLRSTTPIDFPQFLGPNRNAQLDNVSFSDSWPAEPELVWKISIGESWSGFVVVNGFAITQEQRGAEECVTCYDVNTGKLLWINRVNRRHEDPMAMGKVGPRATPTIHEGLVYATSATGVLDCIEGSTGETIWSVDIPKLVGIAQRPNKNSLGLDFTVEDSRMAWGRASSPLIVDDLVVVPAGGPNNVQPGADNPTATLIAFDKATGQEKWRGGNRMIAYGSPTLATIGGKRQILLVAENCVVGHDTETGAELWNFERPGTSNQDANCSQATVVDENRLILSKGYGMGGELVEVTTDGDNWMVASLHKDPRILKTKITNPVLLDGFTYSLSDGYLECVETDTFQRKWKQRGRFGNGQVLLVGDKLLVHAENGKLHLVKANPESYQELGKFKTISGTCWNTICVYGDLVLVRSDSEAACYRLPRSLND